jgi:hypothetical protein
MPEGVSTSSACSTIPATIAFALFAEFTFVHTSVPELRTNLLTRGLRRPSATGLPIPTAIALPLFSQLILVLARPPQLLALTAASTSIVDAHAPGSKLDALRG